MPTWQPPGLGSPLLRVLTPYPSLRCAGTRAPGKFQGEELQPLGALQGPGVKSKWGEAEFMGRGGVKRAPG